MTNSEEVIRQPGFGAECRHVRAVPSVNANSEHGVSGPPSPLGAFSYVSSCPASCCRHPEPTGASSYAQSQADGQWHGGLSPGSALASGIAARARYRPLAKPAGPPRRTRRLYGLLNHGRSTNGVRATTADLARLGGRYDYNPSPDAFAFGGLEWRNQQGRRRAKPLHPQCRRGLSKLVRSESTTWGSVRCGGYTDTKFTNGKSPVCRRCLVRSPRTS